MKRKISQGFLMCMMIALVGITSMPTVHIKDFKFVPATLTVEAGQTVRFINDDQDAHTVTSASGAFESGGLDTGDSWTHVFTKPGTYAYFCALHPYMRATIVVRAKGAKQ